MKQNDLFHKFLSYIDLESELDDFRKIHDIIERDLVFRGTNLWILVFAIIVASVGLNMNSTAVIIGAMLISPLMGPINGMGYSIATYNFPLFRKAVKNFSFAVFASLAASTAYFAISPISTAHSELLARTSPTIYDVLIAFFGGLAGIVAASSRQKGNVIPGVAIATALMPPLCTAGYGLATAQFEYFLGAIYLFTINTVFIALASLVVCQVLKFPITTLVDNAQKKRVNRWISTIITLVLIPSIYFGYNLVQKERFSEKALRLIENVSLVDGNYLLKHDLQPNKRSIILTYGGSELTDEIKESVRRRAEDLSLKNTIIEFRQGLSFENTAQKNNEIENLRLELRNLNLLLKDRERQIDSVTSMNKLGRQILDEIKIIHPSITGCSLTNSYVYGDSSSSPGAINICILRTNGKMLGYSDKQKIHSWLTTRLQSKHLKVFYEE